MKRLIVLTSAIAVAASADLSAQTIPDDAQAARVDLGYRRSLDFRVDPFRHVFVPRWGFVFSVGASLQNNALNLKDIRSLEYIDSNDELLVTDLLDALGLVPTGSGLGLNSLGEGGVYVGGPVGSRIAVGVTAQARGYGGMVADDNAVALLRDGNGAREDFTLGESRGEGIATAELGIHSLIRVGPVTTIDGAVVTVGVGGRFIWPGFYARGRSLIDNGGEIQLSPDTIRASFDVETLVTPDIESPFGRGSGIAGDFMVRVEWPTSGLAFEALLANLGTVSISGVERRQAALDLVTTNLIELSDSLDAIVWDPDTVDVDVNLPRLVRFSASAWANRILQLDLSAGFGLNTGEYDIPLAVDLGSTWRLSRVVPLRLGLVVGGHQGIGYTAGFGVESKNFFFQLAGGSLGGLFRNATGAAVRLDIGAFF